MANMVWKLWNGPVANHATQVISTNPLSHEFCQTQSTFVKPSCANARLQLQNLLRKVPTSSDNFCSGD
ncbi:unnamed protein product [Zymoseptoria tritici ST99CH_3D1]|nr:unnamed protein product [Zymoseptoria tritici ST99CH_3D1]